MRYKRAVKKLRLLAEACDIEVSRQPPAAVAVPARPKTATYGKYCVRDRPRIPILLYKL